MKNTQNENFRTENYNNQNLKLSEWAQQQKGKEGGKSVNWKTEQQKLFNLNRENIY